MTKKEQKSLEEALALMSELYMTEKVNAERLEKALTAMERDRDRLLANAHATQPGAPGEDGVWDVKLISGNDAVVKRKNGINTLTNGMGRYPDKAIIMHRKHTPLEVKHG